MENRNNFCNLRKNYIKLPSILMKINISAEAFKLYTFFIYLPEEANPTISHLANKINVSRKTVYKYLKELEDRNMITKTQQGFCLKDSNKWSSSKYKLNNPKEWNTDDL